MTDAPPPQARTTRMPAVLAQHVREKNPLPSGSGSGELRFTINFRPGEPLERDPKLFCPEHWERIGWHRRAWALLWTSVAIQEDRRFIAALGLVAGTRPSRKQLDKALLADPACCRLGSRAEHLFK